MPPVSIGPAINSSAGVAAVVAALDLKLVRLLRGAMNAGGTGAATPLGPAPNPLLSRQRPVVDPEPRFNPRPVIHPTPKFLPRPVHRPEPRFVPRVEEGKPPVVVVVVEPPEGKTKCPIQAPWEIRPWEAPPEPTVEVKRVVRPPDVVHNKGTLIDLFC